MSDDDKEDTKEVSWTVKDFVEHKLRADTLSWMYTHCTGFSPGVRRNFLGLLYVNGFACGNWSMSLRYSTWYASMLRAHAITNDSWAPTETIFIMMIGETNFIHCMINNSNSPSQLDLNDKNMSLAQQGSFRLLHRLADVEKKNKDKKNNSIEITCFACKKLLVVNNIIKAQEPLFNTASVTIRSMSKTLVLSNIVCANNPTCTARCTKRYGELFNSK